MKNLMTVGATALSALLLLNGCASSSQKSSVNTDMVDPSLQQEEASFFSESGWTACAVGAGIGAIGCLLLADKDHRIGCAATAAVAGCGVFMGANYLLDEVRASYKNREQQLGYLTSLAAKDNEKLKTLNNNAQELLKKQRAELAALDKQVTAGSISADSLNLKLKEVEANADYLSKNIDVAKERLNDYQSVRRSLITDGNGREEVMTKAQQAELKKLDAQIAELESTIALANETYTAMYSERSSLIAPSSAA